MSDRGFLSLALWLCASACILGLASSCTGLIDAALSAIKGARRGPSLPTAALSLDGVQLQLTAPFLPELQFFTPDPSFAIQVATAVDREPLYREFSITAVPFGAQPPTESLPTADWDSEEVYRAALRDHREAQGGNPEAAPAIRLFEKDIAGLRSVVDVPLGPERLTPLVVAEWVVQAGPRIWIVRASQELDRSTAVAPQLAVLDRLYLGIVLTSDHLDQPSTSLATVGQPPTAADFDFGDMIAASLVGTELPFPLWWQGDCDTDFFRAQTGVEAYPLGAEYRGMKACGPRPSFGGAWAYVDFGAGKRQIEWQCPELSKRFLYLAYGIAPYLANGNRVVWNYSGDLLDKVANCQAGRAPQPNDVLSYGSTTTYGHTSVVVASDVDVDGNGRVWVIEQNNSPTGLTSLDVRNWCVEPVNTDVSGWLHRPAWIYYADDELTHRCGSSCGLGTYVFANWGEAGPGGDCPADHFSARFSRDVYFAGGHYTFALDSDGGARLIIGGETVIDGWETPGQTLEIYEVEAGYHNVAVEYRNAGGHPYLTAFWWGPGFELAREARDTSRWYAQYWGNRALWGDPVVMVNEGSGFLDHNWGHGGPADNLPADGFSSRFERTVPFDAGRYRFVVSADDGVRFWIGEDLIIDEWQDQVATYRQERNLVEGNHELKLEHYENKGLAHLRLSWERVDTTTSITGGITSPVYAAVVDGCPLIIEAVVTDGAGVEDSGIKSVEFHAAYDDDWHHLGDAETPPYRWVWDCSSVSNQGVWLALHVWDNEGYQVTDLGGHVYFTLDVTRYVHLPVVLKAR